MMGSGQVNRSVGYRQDSDYRDMRAYDMLVQHRTTTRLSAAQVHDIGVRELTRHGHAVVVEADSAA